MTVEPFDALIRERIPEGPYVLFWCTVEGEVMPNGEEESSGYAIVPSGDTWFWWAGWDAASGRVRIALWEPVILPAAPPGSEYADARAALGL